MKTIADLYSVPADFTNWVESFTPMAGSSSKWKPLYFIAMTARSGSTMLCSMMEKIGGFGIPNEYLNPRGPFDMYHSKYGGKNIIEYLENIRTRSKSHVIGIKTAFLDFYPFATLFTQTLTKYSNFVYLTRLDIYAQAVSLWSAQKTQFWHSTNGTKSEIDLTQYNYSEILITLHRLIEERVKWELYFSLNGTIPLRLNYEEICFNSEKQIYKLAEFLGVDVSPECIQGIQPRTTKLSTNFQKIICEMFKKEIYLKKHDFKIINELKIAKNESFAQA